MRTPWAEALLWLCAGLVVFAAIPLLAFEKPAHRQLPDLDKRTHAGQPRPSEKQRVAERRLEGQGARIDFHNIHGSPQWVRASSGSLTGPDAQPGESAGAIKRFVNDNADLFGHDATALALGAMTRQYTNAHNGVRTFAWEQRLDGIRIYESVFLGHSSARGGVISISSTFLPELAPLAETVLGDRAVLETIPPLRVEEAIGIAAESMEQPVGLLSPTLSSKGGEGEASQRQRFRAANVPGEIEVELVWLPLSRTELRLCWQVELTRRMGGERHRVLVDVETAEILLRRCLTVYAADASFRVFTSDSPSPLSPGYATPSSNQPPDVARSLVTLTSLSTNASPLGWINHGENQTRGNNVDAHLDLNADDEPDLPRPQGSPFRVFDFPLDLAEDPSTYRDAAVVQLFYWGNFVHDQYYDLGFTEAAGNFQKDNFGRGGAGSDPVLADAQDGSGVDNANFTPTPDGISPRVQMYLWTDASLARDGDFDGEVVLHEFTHGLSTRLVGAGVGISELQTAGMGEGWSDFCAMTLLSEAGDDLDGTYAFGGYVTYQLAGMTQNYYYGIRRYPYSTDVSKNPLTFKDIDPSQAAVPSNVPVSPINPFNPLFADEVHAQGEVWCVTLWDARANLIRKHGFSVGNRLILQLVIDGMKLGPANPNYIQARDAILLADQIDNNGANLDVLWSAFSKRGLGFSASAPSSSQSVGVIEAFDSPDLLSISPGQSFISSGTIGGPFSPQCFTYALTNGSSNAVSWSLSSSEAPWLTFSPNGGTLPAFSGTNVNVCITSAARELSSGVFRASLQFSDLTTQVTQTRSVELRVSAVAQLPFSDGFESGRLEGYWLATGTGRYRTHVTGTEGPHTGLYHVTFDTEASGIYARNELTLTVDLGGYTNALLRFWAESFGDEADGPPETPFIGGADFDGVAISADGVAWYEVQPLRAASIYTRYRQYVVNLDAAAAAFGLSYNSAFRIRFNHYDNNPIPLDGIAVDDVSLTGTAVFRFALNAPPRVLEGTGLISGQGQITLSTPAPTDVLFHLASSDPSRLAVAATVLVRAGASSATFDLTAPDDGLLNGSEAITISASADGYFGGTRQVFVDDNDVATIRLRLPAKAVEGAGILANAGSIRLSRKADRDVSVALSSSDPIVAVPPAVIVPAGQSTVSFDLTIADDQSLNGTRAVQVTGHVENWVDGSAEIAIADNDSAALALALPIRVSEGNGTLTNAAMVRLSAIMSSNVTVWLLSSAPSQLQLPANVIVAAGQGSASFNLTVIDDASINGLRTVSITASAPGFVSATASLGLLDDETPPLAYAPSPADGATQVPLNSQLSTVLSWKTGIGELLVNGDFETGDFTGWRLENTPFGSFYINDGKLLFDGLEPTNAPYHGKFTAASSQIPGGEHVLSQDVFIPLDCKSARLSWVDKIRNYAAFFAPNAQEFRVEIRDLANNLLGTVFNTKPGDPLTNDWTRRSFDLSQFRGQNVRVAFVEQDTYSFLNVYLDDISLLLEDSGLTTFDVYFGTNSILSASDFQTNVNPQLSTLNSQLSTFWTPPRLELSTTYYWQIVARRSGATQAVATNAGPVWRFTTRQLGSLHHFDWSAIGPTQQLGQPFAISLTARDDLDNFLAGFNGSVPISAIAGPSSASSILITEIDAGANDTVEFQNVSGRTVDISNWKISLYDRTAFTTPRATVTIPTNTICPPRGIFQLLHAGTAPGVFPIFYMGTNVTWINVALSVPLAVLLRDTNDNVVDFVSAYGADPSLIKAPFAIPHTQWLGDPITANTNAALTLQRIGQRDHNDNSDWVIKPASIGAQNQGLVAPFIPSHGALVSPTNASFVNGTWTGQIAVQQIASNLTLLADDGRNHVGLSTSFAVAGDNDLALDVGYSPDLTVPGNPIQYVLTVRNSGPAAATQVLLSSALPPTAQFVSATASQGACSLINGLLLCSLGTVPGGTNAVVTVNEISTGAGRLISTFRVTGKEPELYLSNNTATAISTVNLPLINITDISAPEGNSGTNSAIFFVRLLTPSPLPVSVAFRTRDGTATAGLDYVATSGTVTFPPGSTNQPITIPLLGDTLSEDALETFEVDLSSPVNAALFRSTATCRIIDDDPLPSIKINDIVVAEPNPDVLANATFMVSLSSSSGLPISVSFITSNGTAVAEKDYLAQTGVLTFVPGVTNLAVGVALLGDRVAESNETFFVRLSAPINSSLGRAVGQCTILDNGFTELDHFSVGQWPSPQYVGVPFVVPMLAKDGRNNLFPNFTGHVSIKGGIPRADVTIGAGTNSWNNPFGTYFHDARTQIIYLANELGGASDFAGLALFVTTPPGQTLSNWTIRLKHTPLAAFAQPSWQSSGWQTVYRNHENISASGWITFLFSAPFHYDGTNNLLVDLSFNNSSYSSDGFARAFSTPDRRTLTFRTDSAFGDPLGWTGASPPPSPANAAPIIRFLREDIVNLSPTSSSNFVSGALSAFVTISQAATNMLLRVSDDAGHNGASDLFVVDSAADVNADGLPDSWQTRYFGLNASNSGPNDDPDHDGANNLQEFRAGTDPLNASSTLRISDVRVVNREVRIQFPSILGKAYRLERTADPGSGNWTVIAPFVGGIGGSVLVVDPDAAIASARFYRLRLLP